MLPWPPRRQTGDVIGARDVGHSYPGWASHSVGLLRHHGIHRDLTMRQSFVADQRNGPRRRHSHLLGLLASGELPLFLEADPGPIGSLHLPRSTATSRSTSTSTASVTSTMKLTCDRRTGRRATTGACDLSDGGQLEADLLTALRVAGVSSRRSFARLWIWGVRTTGKQSKIPDRS